MTDLPQQGIYDDSVRPDVRPFIPTDVRSVLDVGCARGGFGFTLRDVLGPAARLVGVEAVPESAEIASARGFYDEVVEGYFPEALAGRDERFDLVTFNDVLEHIVDPWSLLRVVRERFVAPGGQVLATIPNVGYAPVVWGLVRGRWDYADTGILDRTHVRFFTRASMIELLEGAGFEVVSCEGANNIAADRQWLGHRRKLRHLVGDGQWMHFVLRGRAVGE